MAVLLIRHGETDDNAARVFQNPEAPLSRRGLEQARRLAERLAGIGVAAIVSSDFPRALVTAERLHAATGAPLELWPDLRERNLGLLRGRSHAEVRVDILAPDYEPPGGESCADFRARMARVWARVTERALAITGNLAVVTHGLVCRAVVGELASGGGAPPLWPENASLTIISGQGPHTLELVGCTAHLAEMGAGSDARA